MCVELGGIREFAEVNEQFRKLIGWNAISKVLNFHGEVDEILSVLFLCFDLFATLACIRFVTFLYLFDHLIDTKVDIDLRICSGELQCV